MTLSMKTYKGYNKLPYCNTHYPSTKHTAVADTPENLRLQKNTSNQSQVVYQKDFISQKTKFTAVADDPETLRLKKNQSNASNIEYHQGQKVAGNPAEGAGPVEVRKVSEPAAPAATGGAKQPAPASSGGLKYTAMYDYTAADDDEVSFSEGDLIVNAEKIDDGWMTGTVERTGASGMLPSNYVEPQ